MSLVASIFKEGKRVLNLRDYLTYMRDAIAPFVTDLRIKV